MELSLRWAKRCQDEFARLNNPNALFGIVQGGMFEHLRDESLAGLEALDFPGYCHRRLSAWANPRTTCCASWRTRRPAAAEAQAALPDGRGHTGRPGRRRAKRHRHVRLRHAHPQRTQRHPVQPLWRPEDPQRPPQERPRSRWT